MIIVPIGFSKDYREKRMCYYLVKDGESCEIFNQDGEFKASVESGRYIKFIGRKSKYGNAGYVVDQIPDGSLKGYSIMDDRVSRAHLTVERPEPEDGFLDIEKFKSSEEAINAYRNVIKGEIGEHYDKEFELAFDSDKPVDEFDRLKREREKEEKELDDVCAFYKKVDNTFNASRMIGRKIVQQIEDAKNSALKSMDSFYGKFSKMVEALDDSVEGIKASVFSKVFKLSMKDDASKEAAVEELKKELIDNLAGVLKAFKEQAEAAKSAAMEYKNAFNKTENK